MILIWELHVTCVYLQNSLPAEFGTVPTAQTKYQKSACWSECTFLGCLQHNFLPYSPLCQ